MKTRRLGALLALALLPILPARSQPAPWTSSDLAVETGLLWQVGKSTPIAYRLVPTQLAWRSRASFGHEFAGGSHLVLRHRLSLLGTWVQSGPESRYLALAGCPSLEWWDKSGRWSLFSGVGGGAGWIDSRGVRGGQGQDFTLNWFARGGLEYVMSPRGRLTAGVMFQHMSNGGRTDPNPGIDAVGLTLGWAWSY